VTTIIIGTICIYLYRQNILRIGFFFIIIIRYYNLLPKRNDIDVILIHSTFPNKNLDIKSYLQKNVN
jgi:hypothetical protein